MPVVEPQYNFSRDRNNVTVKFFYNKPIFNNENFNLSILIIDRNIALKHNTIVEPKIIEKIYITHNSFIYLFLISMIGGLILNVMPCVFPVLSLKLLSILSHRPKDIYSVRKSFFITAGGIISSFILLAFALIGVKLSGASIGWGIQFQQPIFLMIIAIILYLFSLNLMGFLSLISLNLLVMHYQFQLINNLFMLISLMDFLRHY